MRTLPSTREASSLALSPAGGNVHGGLIYQLGVGIRASARNVQFFCVAREPRC